MILVFDLDDTLYDEITYVQSGFKAVANYLATNKYVGIDQNKLYQKFLKELEKNGRGRVFNSVLNSLQIESNSLVEKCLKIYRHHQPEIKLSEAGLNCLKRFKNYKKYLVTDGHKLVQKRKIDALGIDKYFEKTYRTYQYGIKYSKPSTYCFELILKKERISPNELVYVGDNPNKDFVNLKKLGAHTIRINQGMFKNIILDKKYEAEIRLDSLDKLTLDLIEKLN